MSIQSLNLISGRALGEKKGADVRKIKISGKTIEIRSLVKDNEPLIYWVAVRFAGRNYQMDIRRQNQPLPPNIECENNRLDAITNWIQKMLN